MLQLLIFCWRDYELVTLGYMGGEFRGFSVIMGAFAAHFLKTRLAASDLQIIETGARYQMYHALALIGIAFLATRVDNKAINTAGLCFIVGSLIFSGSLYLLAITHKKQLGMITPIGGVILIAGWLCLALSTRNL